MIDWQNNKKVKPKHNKAIIALVFDSLYVETGEITDYGFKIDSSTRAVRYLQEEKIRYWAYINTPEQEK